VVSTETKPTIAISTNYVVRGRAFKKI